MNIVAILSGGIGARAQAGMPKQFVDMGGKSLIERTISAFEQHPLIDEIIVVSHPDYIGRLEEMRVNYRKWTKTVPGGGERWQSSAAAVKACEGKAGNLLIHDAARPCVPADLITGVITTLHTHAAAVPVIPVSDTLLEASGDFVKRAHNRQNFRQAQTPQGFHLDVIRKAFAMAENDATVCVTDDCSLILRYLPDIKVKMTDGDICNKKLTYHSDIEEFRTLFEKNI